MSTTENPHELELMIPEEQANANIIAIGEATFGLKIQMWADNFVKNVPKILEGKDALQLSKDFPEKTSALCIGGGPSIKMFNHLQQISDSNYKGKIIVCDKMLLSLLKAGVIPDVVVSIDGDPIVAKFFRHPLIKKYSDEIKAVFCLQTTHPNVVKLWNGDIYWFVALWDDPVNDRRSYSRLYHFMTHKGLMPTAGNVGTTTWVIAGQCGFNPIGLIGMDMGYEDTDNLKKTVYYRPFRNMITKGVNRRLTKAETEKMKHCFRRGTNPDFGNKYITDIMFESYLRLWRGLIDLIGIKNNIVTVNCTERGALHGENIKAMYLKEFLKIRNLNDPLNVIRRNKNEKKKNKS